MVDFNQQPEGSEAVTGGLDEGMMSYENAMMRRNDGTELDHTVFAEFYMHSVDGKDHIKIQFPGDKLYIYDQVADDSHKQRFSRQWKAYQDQTSQFAGQLLLSEVPWLDEAMRNHLKSHNVFTLEQLGGLTDTGLAALGPGVRKLKERAIAVLEDRKAVEESRGMRDQISSQQEQIEAQNAVIEELREQMAKLQAPKRGRVREVNAN